MNKFKDIDEILAKTANELNARLSKDRPGMPEFMRTFEERRIDWNEKEIHKAILIQPDFTANGVDQTKWNFKYLAWENTFPRKSKFTDLIVNKEFSVISSNIHSLLLEAITELNKIKTL